jgi:hypothetical protein
VADGRELPHLHQGRAGDGPGAADGGKDELALEFDVVLGAPGDKTPGALSGLPVGARRRLEAATWGYHPPPFTIFRGTRSFGSVS